MFFAGWRNVREAGPQRLALTALLLLVAVLLARFAWSLPITSEAEQRLYDARAYMLAPEVEPDERVTLVAFTDQTLFDFGKRSPLPRDVLARALRNIDAMGPKAIGIDILFDQPQEEDLDLIETFHAMNTPVAVAYAERSTNEDDISYFQQEYLEAFLAELEGSKVRPASVRLDEGYGVTRRWPDIFDQLPPLLGRVMLEEGGDADRTMPGYTGAIRYRHMAQEGAIDPETGEAQDVAPVFPELDIALFADDELLAIPAVADQFRALIEDRYVLIGGNILDVDRVETTFTSIDGETPPGTRVQATLVAQMLDGARLTSVSPAFLWFFALAVVVTAALTALLEVKSWKIVPLLVGQLVLFIGIPFALHARDVDTYLFPSVGPALGWVLAFMAVTSAARAASAAQRRFAQGALGKYLPASIADEIIDNPELLELGGAKREIYVIFSDLEGFTKMSHALEPEMVAKLLNRYLELLSQVVLEHGGILDKFVGDAVVAFWGAPISRPDDAERAARAGYALWQAGEQFRQEVAAMDPDLPPIGKTRVGMHFGEAVVGNFGGENRIQYTALGDSMNTAARLEAANKALESSTMASEEFASRTGLDWWRPMGRVVLRGRRKPVDIFEPAPDFADSDKVKLEKAMKLIETDLDGAIALVEEVVTTNPADKALQNLLERCRGLNEERAYVLG